MKAKFAFLVFFRLQGMKKAAHECGFRGIVPAARFRPPGIALHYMNL